MDRLRWIGPDGTVLDLHAPGSAGIQAEAGVAGLGAAPRAIARRDLATGGSIARWSHASERLITLPLLLTADTPAVYRDRLSDLTALMLATTPAAGPPRAGRLRFVRSDGTWRQTACVYSSGLEGVDPPGAGQTWNRLVLQLIAPEPWWFGPETVALAFEPTVRRSYLAPYETTSPDIEVDAIDLAIDGDIPAAPIWTVTGPATSVSVRLLSPADSAGMQPVWRAGPIGNDQQLIIDSAAGTVIDHTGANRIDALTWPDSTLYHLPAGRIRLRTGITGGLPGTSLLELVYAPRWETA